MALGNRAVLRISGFVGVAVFLMGSLSIPTCWAQLQSQVIPLEHDRSLPVNEIQVITPHGEVQHVVEVKPAPHFFP